MLAETERVGNRKIAHTIKTPEDIEELKQQMNSYNQVTGINHLVIDSTRVGEPKKHFFDKVKSIFKKK